MSGGDNDDSAKEEFSVRKRVSIVWSYFDKLNRFRVRCKLCSHEQNYQGTTGNILRHLKNKHDIDATLKGQRTNPNIRELLPVLAMQDKSINANGDNTFPADVFTRTRKNEEEFSDLVKDNYDTDIHGGENKMETAVDEQPNIDPYKDEPIMDFTDYMRIDSATNYAQQNLRKAEYANDYSCRKSKLSREKHDERISEERLIAEIEYFREKAAFYRMQKNLIALQARKIRYELDQLG